MKKKLEKNRLDLSDAGIEILGLNLINIDYSFNNYDMGDNPDRISFYGVYGERKDRNSATNIAVECYFINYKHIYWYRYEFDEAVELYNFLRNEELSNLEK